MAQIIDVTIQRISWKKIALLGSTDQSFFICWEVGVGDFEGSHDFHWRGQRSNLSSLTEYTSKGGEK